MTFGEFKSIYLKTIPKPEKPQNNGNNGQGRFLQSSMNSIDWVGAGVVTPVKNQGYCGSCWAFSASGAIESLKILKEGYPKSSTRVSEQHQVDCVYDYSGCRGGWMEDSFNYAKNIGI